MVPAMAATSRIVAPTPGGGLKCAETGERLDAPEGWALLPPGDAALTRRVKAEGEHWLVQEKRGRRLMSRGVWAPAERIERVRGQLERERAKPAYARQLEASRERRARDQEHYVDDFHGAVLAFLDFAPAYQDLARSLAVRVTEHTTPVGSGTVGRTKRIPIADRAAASVIAWLRHHTTSYDDMDIARVRGQRRKVRRRLAQRSQELLGSFRRGEPTDPEQCPLHQALKPVVPRPTKPLPTPPRPSPEPRAASSSRTGRPLWEQPLRKR
jgi:hypothetical protein